MPLHTLIQMECDNCGHCDYSEHPKLYAIGYFKELGYLMEGNKWFCDDRCKNNYKAKLNESCMGRE